MAVVSGWRVFKNRIAQIAPASDQTAGYEADPSLLPVVPVNVGTDWEFKYVPRTSFSFDSYNTTSAFDVSGMRYLNGQGGFTAEGVYRYPEGTFAAYVPWVEMSIPTSGGEPVAAGTGGGGWAYATEGRGRPIEFSESGGTEDTVSLFAHRNTLVQLGRNDQYVFSGYNNDPLFLVPIEIRAYVGYEGEIFHIQILNGGEGYKPNTWYYVTVPGGNNDAEIYLQIDDWGNLGSWNLDQQGSGYAGVEIDFFAPDPISQGFDVAPSGVHHIVEAATCWRIAAHADGFSIQPLTTPPWLLWVGFSSFSGYAREEFGTRHGVDISQTDWGSNGGGIPNYGLGKMADLEGPMGPAFVWADDMVATVQCTTYSQFPPETPAAMQVKFYRVELKQVEYEIAKKWTGGDGDTAAVVEFVPSMYIPVATELLGTATIPVEAFTIAEGESTPPPITISLPEIDPGTIVSATWAFPTPEAAAGTNPFSLAIIAPPGAPAIGVHWTADKYAWPKPPTTPL
jgi:hypothetical protein